MSKDSKKAPLKGKAKVEEPKAKGKAKVEEPKAKGKAKVDPKEAEKAAKRAASKAARMEKIKNRPAGQRPNSKQVDVIEAGKGKVEVFAAPVRKFGCIITSVALNEKGDVIGTSITALAGFKPKSKKGHGTIVQGVPGLGKHRDKDEDEDEDENED